MLSAELKIIGIEGLPEVGPDDSLPALLAQALDRSSLPLLAHDVMVVAQKIVSKSEGRLIQLDSVEASQLAHSWAKQSDLDPRFVELVLRQSRRVVRMDRGQLIVETHQGWICANAGVDTSNTPEGTAALLPEDCDRSAQQIRDALRPDSRFPLAVVISDSHGRPWRLGQINVALGVAGMSPLKDYRGAPDQTGRILRKTLLSPADEVAAAAGLVMGKTRRVPVVLIRGMKIEGEGGGQALLRKSAQDLFR